MVKALQERMEVRSPRPPFALLFIDIDDFKLINDGHGHDVGDRFLCEFVKRVQPCLSTSDILARFGGDEFVILLESASDDRGVSEFVENLRTSLAAPIRIDGTELFTAVSIGVAAANDSHEHYNQLLLEADTAMFAAKSRGKSRYVWFDSQMQREALERLSFERSLHKAAENNELEVLYQPVVEIQSGRVLGFEALLRWHPPGGTVSPLRFIPVAERTGAIHRIGLWVLETACAQLAQWTSIVPGLTVAVNISPVQLEQQNFAARVIDIVNASALSPEAVTIEVTESGAIKDFDNAFQVLTQLRNAGLRVSVDDFGTGHSSLSHLHRLPVTEVKIDKSFVQAMNDANDYSRLFIETIHTLACSIGLETVAEGIETKQQRESLVECGYTRGQGFLFSPPMDCQEATSILTRAASGLGGLCESLLEKQPVV